MDLVVKRRYGNGSIGLWFTAAAELARGVVDSAEMALGEAGRPAADGPAAVEVQEELPGHEHGADDASSLDGSLQLLGVLAPCKEQMRGGDTVAATTVSPESYRESLRLIGKLLHPSGAINVDLRESVTWEPRAIDIIRPRWTTRSGSPRRV